MNERTERVPCISAGRDEPRVLKARHVVEHAHVDDCRGCEPCPERHCIICRREHVTQQTCPECVGGTRDDLFEVRRLWRDLPRQALIGANNGKLEAAREMPGGEAMVLLAPGSHGKGASAAKRRGDDATHLADELDGEAMLPELCLVGWEEDWRRIVGNPPDPDVPATLDDAAQFLDDRLSWAAQHHDAFDAFVREIRDQRHHLEEVLHAGIREETGAPCLICDRPLVLEYAPDIDGVPDPDGDRWVCVRDNISLAREDYARNTAQEARGYAPWLTAADMLKEYGIKIGTLQGWASKELVAKRRDVNLGRMVYRVDQALALRDVRSEPA